MARLGWGKKAITEGCINDWYKDRPIGTMARDMRDNHRLLAQEYGGGKYKDSILVYDRCKFMKILNLPEPDVKADPAQTYIELAVAVKYYQGVAKYKELTTERVGEPFPVCWSCYEPMQVILADRQPTLEMLLHGDEEVDAPCEICGADYLKHRDVVIVHVAEEPEIDDTVRADQLKSFDCDAQYPDSERSYDTE